ncbi:MAG: YebC/PmpR family DNA-binding transcriptional regulator [Planctomycetes bacterium]|nr:YebC/PmpR family DNA-binding transcriptional regulator [Planctomycetota bacterium]
MGRQWLQKNKEITANKKAKITSKLVREITVAAKMGTPDPDMNPRLALAIEAARKQSVSNDVIKRAINKGAGIGGESVEFETILYEGMAPHNVPLIVECLTDNRNRTGSDIKSLWKNGQFGSKVMFLFDHCGIVEATHEDGGVDIEEAAIEAEAQDVEPLEGVPEDHSGGRFFTDVPDLYKVADALRAAGWNVASAELGYVAKDAITLEGDARTEVEEFLEKIDDHDDVHRIHAALK